MEGEDLDLYVEHMKVAEVFAHRNHEVIVDEICSHMGWRVEESILPIIIILNLPVSGK